MFASRSFGSPVLFSALVPLLLTLGACGGEMETSNHPVMESFEPSMPTDPSTIGLVYQERLLLPEQADQKWLVPGSFRLEGGGPLGETVMSMALERQKMPSHLASLLGSKVRVLGGGHDSCEAMITDLRVYRSFLGMKGTPEELLELSMGETRTTNIRQVLGSYQVQWRGGGQTAESEVSAEELWDQGEAGESVGAQLALPPGCAGDALSLERAPRFALPALGPRVRVATPDTLDPHLAEQAIVAQRSLPGYVEHQEMYKEWRARSTPSDLPIAVEYWEQAGGAPRISQLHFQAPGRTDKVMVLVKTDAREGDVEVCGDSFHVQQWTLWEAKQVGRATSLVFRGQGSVVHEQAEIIDVDGTIYVLSPGEKGPKVEKAKEDGVFETLKEVTFPDYDYVFVCPC